MLLTAVVVLATIAFASCVALYYLIVQQGRILLRLESVEADVRRHDYRAELGAEGLRPGSVVNDFDLPSLGGDRVTLSQFRGRKVLLIFFDPACGFCRSLLPEIRTFSAASHKDEPVLLLISQGSAEENRSLMGQHGVAAPVLLQEQREVAELYRVFATPAGYLLDERGATIGGLLMGKDQIFAAARGRPSSAAAPHGVSPAGPRSVLVRDGLKAGMSAPIFNLCQVDGGSLSLSDLRGQNVLLVFSDPACGPCNAVAPKLEKLHREKTDLRVVMISRGSIEANRAKIAEFGLTFPVVLQRHWEISREYGMFATPIAYVIDPQGLIRSDVLVGAEAILGAASRK